MHEYSVYIHTNKANGMKYVGITSQNVETRWLNGYGYYKQPHFFNAIKKYGWCGFTHEVVASGLTLEEAGRLEAELIRKYDTTNNERGYNKSVGGECGAIGVEKTERQRTEASKRLKALWEDESFRESRRQKTIEINKRESVREKRSESNRTRIVSEETKRKMSENRRGKGTGPFTEEHKAKIKENHAGGAEKVPVVCVETGKTYPSIADAARDVGVKKHGISACCRKVPHYNTAGGYHWRFAEVIEYVFV